MPFFLGYGGVTFRFCRKPRAGAGEYALACAGGDPTGKLLAIAGLFPPEGGGEQHKCGQYFHTPQKHCQGADDGLEVSEV